MREDHECGQAGLLSCQPLAKAREHPAAAARVAQLCHARRPQCLQLRGELVQRNRHHRLRLLVAAGWVQRHEELQQVTAIRGESVGAVGGLFVRA